MLKKELTDGSLTRANLGAIASPPSLPVQVTDELLQEITHKIVSGFSPEKVILFGSYVWGRPHSNSDVDLLVVMKIGEDPVDVEARILLQCRPPFVPMDVLVRPPEEIAERLGRGDFFIRRILQQGRVLYDRSA